LNVLRNGGNVAVPFADLSANYVGNRAGLQSLPTTWQGYHVIDGDESDLRFQDTRGRKHGRVVGLKLKAHSTVERQQAIASGLYLFSVEDKNPDSPSYETLKEGKFLIIK